VLAGAKEGGCGLLDAEKLWTRIGKPWKRFNEWAAHFLKPLIEAGEKTAITVYSIPTKTKPRTGYTLSRDLAADLAQQANTKEGADVRHYFRDMERAALRLSEFNRSRGLDLAEADAGLQHFTRKRAAELKKAGKITDAPVTHARDREQTVKRLVCEVLTGLSTSAWKERCGRRIRDTLDSADLQTYGVAYTLAVNLLQVRAATNEDALRDQLGRLYANRIDPDKYGQSGSKPRQGEF
jgi:anti-repressor protein